MHTGWVEWGVPGLTVTAPCSRGEWGVHGMRGTRSPRADATAALPGGSGVHGGMERESRADRDPRRVPGVGAVHTEWVEWGVPGPAATALRCPRCAVRAALSALRCPRCALRGGCGVHEVPGAGEFPGHPACAALPGAGGRARGAWSGGPQADVTAPRSGGGGGVHEGVERGIRKGHHVARPRFSRRAVLPGMGAACMGAWWSGESPRAIMTMPRSGRGAVVAGRGGLWRVWGVLGLWGCPKLL
ncbi:hypothetical protein GCM10023259_052080 [Thermocatellispora tengchongensis]